MNKQIVVAAFVITGAGVVNAIMAKKPLSKIIMGGYVFLLVLSLFDLFGGPISQLASALSMVALVYVILNVFPWVTVIKQVQGKK